MKDKIKIGIIGGAGYTAGELLRIIINHKNVDIDFVYSTSSAGEKLYKIHRDLFGTTNICFTDKINPQVDLVFLCTAHGDSGNFLKNNNFSAQTRIIDLSNEFRLKNDSHFMGRDFVYGLPETNLEAIKKAKNIANPGCFATAIQLALLPLAEAKLLNDNVHINAITGSTGAGVKPSSTTHYSWRADNISFYKPFTHQHLGEINETVCSLQPSFKNELLFLALRGNFARGIFATAYTKFEGSLEEAKELYKDYYKNDAFVFITDEKEPDLKMVTGTNKCVIGLLKHGDYLLITSIIDNLIKGASGQAIHNMNLMFGFDEYESLNLKATTF